MSYIISCIHSSGLYYDLVLVRDLVVTLGTHIANGVARCGTGCSSHPQGESTLAFHFSSSDTERDKCRRPPNYCLPRGLSKFLESSPMMTLGFSGLSLLVGLRLANQRWQGKLLLGQKMTTTKISYNLSERNLRTVFGLCARPRCARTATAACTPPPT